MEKITSEVMTKDLVTVVMGAPLSDAFVLMRDRRIRHLPVTDEAGEVIGILSDRDISRAMTPDPEADPSGADDAQFDPSFRARDFMTWPVRTVADDVPVQDVARRMLKEKVSALLVVDRTRKIRGIVTTDDLLKLLIRLLDKERGGLVMTLDSITQDWGFSAGNWM
ncbi:MAG: CBS domain-containing protein [Bdellovibrionota bacterium]